MAHCSNSTHNSTLHPFLVDNLHNVTVSCARFDFCLYTVIVGLTCFLGVIGNLLSFAVLLRSGGDSGRSATSFLLQALAVGDCLVLLAAVPLYVLPFVYPYTGALRGYYDSYATLMPYLWPLYLIPYTGSIMVTVLVSLDRYVAVCRPFSSTAILSPRKIRVYVIAMALFAVLYNIPRFFEYEAMAVCADNGEMTSTFGLTRFGSNRLYRILYGGALYFIMLHGGPLLCLGFLNVKLVQSLRERHRKRVEMGHGRCQGQSRKTSNDRDITLGLIVVVFVFIVCQTPTLIDHVMWTFVDESERQCGRWHYYYTAFGDALAILNSAVNFIIYVLTSRRFRQGLRLCDWWMLFGRAGRSGESWKSRTWGKGPEVVVDRAGISTTGTYGGDGSRMQFGVVGHRANDSDKTPTSTLEESAQK